MKTLSDILAEKDSITNMAKGLGVINLRIFQLEGEEDTLHLLVDLDQRKSGDNTRNNGLLEAWIIKKINCKVMIAVSEKLEEFYRDDIIANAVGLDDRVN